MQRRDSSRRESVVERVISGTIGALGGDSVNKGIDKILGSSGLAERLDAARAKADRRQLREEKLMAMGKGKSVAESDLPFQSACLFIIGVFALYNTLVYFSSVFVPFVVAIFLM